MPWYIHSNESRRYNTTTRTDSLAPVGPGRSSTARVNEVAPDRGVLDNITDVLFRRSRYPPSACPPGPHRRYHGRPARNQRPAGSRPREGSHRAGSIVERWMPSRTLMGRGISAMFPAHCRGVCGLQDGVSGWGEWLGGEGRVDMPRREGGSQELACAWRVVCSAPWPEDALRGLQCGAEIGWLGGGGNGLVVALRSGRDGVCSWGSAWRVGVGYLRGEARGGAAFERAVPRSSVQPLASMARRPHSFGTRRDALLSRRSPSSSCSATRRSGRRAGMIRRGRERGTSEYLEKSVCPHSSRRTSSSSRRWPLTRSAGASRIASTASEKTVCLRGQLRDAALAKPLA